MEAEAGGERVLLVDPAGDLEGWLGDALREAGFVVTSVADASECLRRVESGSVDAVCSRYALPDVDGVRLLRSIRISRPELPFLLLPVEGSESVAGEAVAAGVSGYVPDDAGVGTVLDRLRDSLRREEPWVAGERHDRYRHLIEISPAPINVFDETGESIWGNDAVLDLLGLDGRDELIGRSIFEFIDPEDHDLARSEMGDVIDEKRSTGPTRMRLRRPDGEVRHIQVSTAIGSFLGEDVGQAVVVDVTDQEERERQLKVLEAWLRHNIRNDMNVIGGIAENIRDGRVDDVAAAAGRIGGIADHLVEQADTERRLVELLVEPPEPVPVDVVDAVEAEVRKCRERYPEADIEVVVDGGFTAMAVPAVEDAIGELLENAIRHSDAAAPSVRVTIERGDGDRGYVRVADEGPGIPDVERHVFRSDHRIDQLHHGSGLGLLFVYWVVRVSGGEVEFGANEPRGSAVTLTFRAAAGEHPG